MYTSTVLVKGVSDKKVTRRKAEIQGRELDEWNVRGKEYEGSKPYMLTEQALVKTDVVEVRKKDRNTMDVGQLERKVRYRKS